MGKTKNALRAHQREGAQFGPRRRGGVLGAIGGAENSRILRLLVVQVGNNCATNGFRSQRKCQCGLSEARDIQLVEELSAPEG